jgi:hypothetical protein
MPNQSSSHNPANTFFPVASSSGSSSAALKNPYAGHERPRSLQASRLRDETAMAPEAIWGQFNNYRSSGLTGSVVVHLVVVGLILAGATFGHQVVEQAKPRETVTLIAPSPDSYALPVAKKIASGGGGGGDHD